MILLVVDVAMVVAIFKTVVVVGVVIAGFVGRVIPVLVLLLLGGIHHPKVAFFVSNSCSICFQPHFCFILQ